MHNFCSSPTYLLGHVDALLGGLEVGDQLGDVLAALHGEAKELLLGHM